ncbi:tRNA(Ile)-lysidine synthase TilS/MesJ [Natranaerovirga pectinivora]|uniref:tRNA(Ile)-lysidine synthase TilS/MesJ n=1 Tax=Natranaerovirga pectinivora TaxID=682400 RepID=A0A4R3MM97_9FIRM|nr:ATP-binding protein [Natranaerovirga pectinivora]TCT16059.1 tRNA(Ile)-lysidine synthase TilS/MesJ [Natranaerovirga pectinivora]
MNRAQEVERSINKTFKESIWSKFLKGIKTYDLIQEGDKIAVCISGGKDSMLLAKCMQLLQRYSIYPFEIEYLVMDPGYNPINRKRIEDNAKMLDVPVRIFDTDIFEVVASVDESPCYLCAKMRRGYLYKNAKDLGCNKIALGHHFDDVIETTLMSMFYGSEIKTMMPKLHSQNFEGMELIRPLYMVKEAAIIEWMKHNDLKFIQCACRFTENCVLDGQGGGSKRGEMKALIKKMKKENPYVDMNIFNSTHNVNMDTIQGYRKNGEKHSFLEEYE